MDSQDQGLIRRFLNGDREAVGTIDGWIENAAWPYRRRLAGQWDDVLQDIRLELTRLLREDKFRGESAFKTYLWRVVNHACLDRLRMESRRRYVDIEKVEEELEQGRFLLTSPGEGHLEQDLMQRVLQKTSAACRELWALIVAGYSYAEMSIKLGVTEGALRVRVVRCRQRAIAIREKLLLGLGDVNDSDGEET